MSDNIGARPSETGSRASHEAAKASSPSGFDPARTPWLHIRSQFTYHHEAIISGTREGLLSLKAAVETALDGVEGEASAFASDGEGYAVIVRRSSTVGGIGKPTYLDEEARRLAYMERDYLVREERTRRTWEKEAGAAILWCRQNGNPHLAPIEAGTDETQSGSARRAKAGNSSKNNPPSISSQGS